RATRGVAGRGRGAVLAPVLRGPGSPAGVVVSRERVRLRLLPGRPDPGALNDAADRHRPPCPRPPARRARPPARRVWACCCRRSLKIESAHRAVKLPGRYGSYLPGGPIDHPQAVGRRCARERKRQQIVTESSRPISVSSEVSRSLIAERRTSICW